MIFIIIEICGLEGDKKGRKKLRKEDKKGRKDERKREGRLRKEGRKERKHTVDLVYVASLFVGFAVQNFCPTEEVCHVRGDYS